MSLPFPDGFIRPLTFWNWSLSFQPEADSFFWIIFPYDRTHLFCSKELSNLDSSPLQLDTLVQPYFFFCSVLTYTNLSREVEKYIFDSFVVQIAPIESRLL